MDAPTPVPARSDTDLEHMSLSKLKARYAALAEAVRAAPGSYPIWSEMRAVSRAAIARARGKRTFDYWRARETDADNHIGHIDHLRSLRASAHPDPADPSTPGTDV